MVNVYVLSVGEGLWSLFGYEGPADTKRRSTWYTLHLTIILPYQRRVFWPAAISWELFVRVSCWKSVWYLLWGTRAHTGEFGNMKARQESIVCSSTAGEFGDMKARQLTAT